MVDRERHFSEENGSYLACLESQLEKPTFFVIYMCGEFRDIGDPWFSSLSLQDNSSK